MHYRAIEVAQGKESLPSKCSCQIGLYIETLDLKLLRLGLRVDPIWYCAAVTSHILSFDHSTHWRPTLKASRYTYEVLNLITIMILTALV
jgi:hypothetical protein